MRHYERMLGAAIFTLGIPDGNMEAIRSIQAETAKMSSATDALVVSDLSKFADADRTDFQEKVNFKRFRGVQVSQSFDSFPQIASSVDWSWMFPDTIQDQFKYECNASWPIVTSDVLSALNFSRLPAEYLTKCWEMSCADTNVHDALEVLKLLGSCDLEDYKANGCGCTPRKIVRRFQAVPPAALEQAVLRQPVLAAVRLSDELQFYQKGVITPKCTRTPNHEVVVVGLGTSLDGVKYWKMRNTWGPDWGEDGYFRMSRERGCEAEREALQVQVLESRQTR